jgi:aspartate kinase
MRDLLVVKLGGSVLSDQHSIARAVEALRRELKRGKNVVLVVSALKGVTDTLIETTRRVYPKLSEVLLAEILSSGEKTSARILADALTKSGENPVVIDTDSPLWPIITDEKLLDANPLFEETAENVRRCILPLLESGQLPIVCGFIAKSRNNTLTTLGRGGSDTTAILLGSCLGAEEVILVKDVEAAFSADPKKVLDVIPLEILDSEEAYVLSLAGAKLLQPKALRYKLGEVKVRITTLTQEYLTTAGTIIEGKLGPLVIDVWPEAAMMITIVGNGFPESEVMPQLNRIVSQHGGRVLMASVAEKTAVLYVTQRDGIFNEIHAEVMRDHLGKAASCFEDLIMITARGGILEISPGTIQRVTSPLARERINIYGVVTIGSSVRIFVLKDDADRAVQEVRQALEEKQREA